MKSVRFVELNICRTVQEIMCKLNDDELGDLRTRHFWMKAEHLRMQAKVGKVTKQFRLGPISAALSSVVYVPSAASFSEQRLVIAL